MRDTKRVLSCLSSCLSLSHPLHALVLVVGRLLDPVHVVLEGGVTPGVVLLLLREKTSTTRQTMGTGTEKKGSQAKNVRARRTSTGQAQGKHGEGFREGAV